MRSGSGGGRVLILLRAQKELRFRYRLEGPFAKDMPYTKYTDPTLERIAVLEPKTFAVMHGSSFSGDGARSIRERAQVIRELLGPVG